MYRTTLFFFALVSLGLSRPEIGNIGGIRVNTHSRSPDARIIGGDIASDREAHFIVHLTVYYPNDPTEHICAGTLLTNRHILTSASCVHGSETILVLLGAHDIAHPESYQKTWSYEHIVHEKFNETTLENDIAILKLQSDVEFSSSFKISKIQLPESAKKPEEYIGETGRIYGWGAVVDDPTYTTVKVLRYADVTVLSNSMCRNFYENIFDTEICTSAWSLNWRGHMVGVCGTDFGGPLMMNNIQIGIISFSSLRCESGSPSGYTRIDKYLVWIDDAVAKLGY